MIFDSSIVGSLTGLIVIAIAWILQIMSSWNGNKEIRKRFLIVQCIGIAILVIDGFMNNIILIAVFNLIIFVLAALLLTKIGKSDEKPTRIKKKRK